MTIKPEIAKLIITGEYGENRQDAGFMIAKECRGLGKNFFEVRGILLAWNLRNRPPMPIEEIEVILQSVFLPVNTLIEGQKTKKKAKEELLSRQLKIP